MRVTNNSNRTQKSGETIYGWPHLANPWEQMATRVGAQSSENLDAWLSSLSAFADTQKTLLERTAAYFEKAIASQWEAARALAPARTPVEAARIQANLGAPIIDSAVREATEVLQLASQGMAAAWAPLRARASSMMMGAPPAEQAEG